MVTPLAVFVLGEHLSPSGLLGIALVVAGIFVTHSGFLRSLAGAGARPAVALAALTGVMIAGYSLVNKVGVQTVPVVLWAFLVPGICRARSESRAALARSASMATKRSERRPSGYIRLMMPGRRWAMPAS